MGSYAVGRGRSAGGQSRIGGSGRSGGFGGGGDRSGGGYVGKCLDLRWVGVGVFFFFGGGMGEKERATSSRITELSGQRERADG